MHRHCQHQLHDDVIEREEPEEDLSGAVGAGSKSTPGGSLPGEKSHQLSIWLTP